jgi:aspartate carbamoyltransferase catalytic subunit
MSGKSDIMKKKENIIMIKHLIDVDDFTIDEIEELFNDAKSFINGQDSNILKDKIVITIFFENSTRTKSSFEIAAKRLGADVVNLDVSRSSTSKGETLLDTSANLNAMNPDAIIIRHQQSGVPKSLSQHLNCPILNAGDGSYAHPSQALLDLFTIKNYIDDVKGKKIAIVGDIKSSRVANSNIKLLQKFGLEIIMVSPPHFKPNHNLRHVNYLSEVIDECDIVMSLRTQTERHQFQMYGSLQDYGNDYCITKEIFKDKNIILLHPGPVHRNIDIDDEMLSDPRCKVLEQVSNGVAIRMAILKKLITESL